MSYATLMVHLQLGQSNSDLLQLAAGLARRFDAGLIGVTACRPMQVVYGDGYYVSAELIDEDRAEKERQGKAAEAEFRSAFHAHHGYLEWQSAVTLEALAGCLARMASCADLVITGVTSGALINASPDVSIGDLIMQIGRPVLSVPAKIAELNLDHVILAWKDTRESRRAASDALPLLKHAARVSVFEITPADALDESLARLESVVGWLGRHGIAATSFVETSEGDDGAQMLRIADQQDASMVVAGGYGHNRVREWALGGVTRDLLLKSPRCSLLSH